MTNAELKKKLTSKLVTFGGKQYFPFEELLQMLEAGTLQLPTFLPNPPPPPPPK